MKIPRFLKTFMAFFIVIALIRAIFNAPPISVYDLLIELQSFEFNIDPIVDLINDFQNGSFNPDFKNTWDENLEGFEGFFKNIGRCIGSLFTVIKDVFVSITLTLWSTLTEIVRLIGQLLTIIFKIIGLDQATTKPR